MYTLEGLIIFLVYLAGVFIAIALIGWVAAIVLDRVRDNRWMQEQGASDRSWGLEPIEFSKPRLQKHYDKGYNS